MSDAQAATYPAGRLPAHTHRYLFDAQAGGNADLRGSLNAGHRRTGVTYRSIGDGGNQTVRAFPSYCAVAVADLGSLPDTILTHS